MHHWDTVAIVGVGLIGGSIGLALCKRKLAKHVIGIGRRESSLAEADRLGCVNRTTTNLANGVKAANLVVVCTPIDLIVQTVKDAAAHMPAGAFLTDAGSTKGNIVALAEEEVRKAAAAGGRSLAFVGSHPIAGSEKTGPEAAQADLFEGRVVVMTPTAHTDRGAVQEIEAFWQALGARVVRMSPDEHDAALARTSHLPHLVASALAAATPEELLPLTAGGFLDTTRIAAGDIDLWRQIFLANGGHTLKALADFETVLSRLRRALESGDGAALAGLLTEGKRRRDAVGS